MKKMPKQGVETFTVRSIAATWRVAERVAREVANGGVIALEGDLGAGKTTFVQGIARALGVSRPVTSPTFTLVSEYQGAKNRLAHFDLYRLHSAEDLLVIGFQEYIDSGAIIAIEWPDRAEDLLPPHTIHISLTLTDAPNARCIVVNWNKGMERP